MDIDFKHSGIADYIDTEDPELQRILLESMLSTEMFIKTFMPEFVDGVWTWQRKAHLALLDDDTVPYGGCCGYRALGKTSLAVAHAVKNFCFRKYPFVVWLSKTEDAAIEQTEAIKDELTSNPQITAVFGNFRPESIKGVQKQFSRKAFYVADPKTGAVFGLCNPRGIGQPIRGKRITLMGRSTRPSFLYADDTEDDEEVMNADYRKKYRKYFYGSFLKCVDRNKLPQAGTNRWKKPDPGDKAPWRCFLNDTIKHEDSNMARVIQDGSWVVNVFPQAEKRADGQYYSLVPDIVTDEQVRADQKWHESEGEEDTFAMEILCMPMAPDGSAWTRESYRYYGEDELSLNDLGREFKFIVVDPAKVNKATAANSAALAVGVDTMEKKIYFRSLFAHRVKLDRLPHIVFDMAIMLNTPSIYIEITGQEENIELLWENAARERGLDRWIEFIPLDRRGMSVKGDFGKGKEAPKRAHSSLALPYYSRGEVYHERSLKNGPLELQQLAYPKCSKWDCMDCMAYVPHIMLKNGLFWAPKIADRQYEEILENARDWDSDDHLGRRIRDREWALQ